jgi:hypothetical protein
MLQNNNRTLDFIQILFSKFVLLPLLIRHTGYITFCLNNNKNNP